MRIPSRVLAAIGRNKPIFRAKSRQSGICQIEAIIKAILPAKFRPTEYTARAGEIKLLIVAKTAKNTAATNSFSIMSNAFAHSNRFRLIGADNTE